MDPDFPELTVPHLISQSELNDLARELNLSKIHAEILASSSQWWNFYSKVLRETPTIIVIMFSKDGQFYEQTDGVAMVSPLSPIIANFYMEDFGMKATKKATHKPACWYRYVDDTFVIWPHGKEKLTEFLNNPSGIHNNIQFTMEI